MIMKVVTIHTKVSIRATCCSPGWTMILYTHRRCLEVALLRHAAVRDYVRLWDDIVAKVFLGWRTKIPRAADASYARRREGPYRFIQNRSRTFAVALKSDAAAEKSKDRLSRDF
jgi:hypothetical protein